MAIYGSSLCRYVIFAFRTNFHKDKIPFFFVEDKNHTLKVADGIFEKQSLFYSQYTRGIQKENEIHLQRLINYTSYIFPLPLANVVGPLLSDVCGQYS